jgi:phosphosulfolactate synthase
LESLVFEAPQKAQQVWLLHTHGPSVNLANIALSDVIPVETLRLGLRADTLVDVHGGDDGGG